jgi:subtilase family serine protease
MVMLGGLFAAGPVFDEKGVPILNEEEIGKFFESLDNMATSPVASEISIGPIDSDEEPTPPPPMPDLIVEVNISGGMSPYTVTATVRNIGQAAADASGYAGWALFYYEGWPQGDRHRLLHIPALAPGESYSEGMAYDNVVCTDGGEDFEAYADFDLGYGDEIDESDEGNNLNEINGDALTCRPDYISSIGMAPNAPRQHGIAPLRVTTTNIGDADEYTDSYTYLEDARHNWLDYQTVGNLPAFGGSTSFDSKQRCAAGEEVTFYSMADVENNIIEHDDDNNENSTTIMCPGTPDYIVSIGNVRNDTAAGHIGFNVTTSNVGTDGAGSNSITQFLIDNGTGYLSIPALPRYGVASQYVATSCVPGTVVILGANADYDGNITESNESNNGADEVRVGCPGMPDYIVSLGTPDTSVDRQITIGINTSNAGDAAATEESDTRVTFDYGQMSNIAGGSIDLNVPALGVGATDPQTWTINCMPGTTIRLGAHADQFDAINESNESNNDADGISVMCPGKPDYVVSLGTPDTSVDRQITIGVNTSNVDAVAATVESATRVAFDYGQMSNIAGGSIDLNVPALGVGATDQQAVTINCTPGRSIQIGAHADQFNAINESNESNNDADGISVICPGKPDYVVLIETVDLSVAGEVRINVTTRNQGDMGAAESSNTHIEASSGANYDFPTDPLDVDAQVSWIDPYNCEPGTQLTVNVTADYNGNIIESNEGNNFASISVMCPGPDYIVSFENVVNTTMAGEISFDVNTSNIGTADADHSSITRYYLNGIGYGLGVPALPMGGSASNPVTKECTPGTEVALTAIADIINEIQEINETNNGAVQVTVICPGMPDYVASIAITDLSVAGEVRINVTTRNQGDAAATGASVTDVLVEENPTLSLNVSALDAGASDVQSAAIPCTPGATVAINANADATGALAESNEGNNAAGEVSVVCPGSDYVVTITDANEAEQPAGPAAVNLGTAGNFAILSKSGISTTGTTSIVGDIGVSPIDSTAITGFGLIMDASNQFATSSLVTGRAYAADYAPPTPTVMTTAVSDMETAYTDAAGRTDPTATELGAGNIGGMTLAPGLYKWSTGVTIPTGVTLDCQGNTNAVFIFQIEQNLDVGNDADVTLSGGCQARNIFWQVAGQATLGTTSNVNGIILSQTAIVMNNGARLNGRALAQTAVTLIANSVATDGIETPIGNDGKFFLNVTTTNIGLVMANSGSETNISLNDYRFNAIHVEALPAGASYSEIKAVDCSPGLPFWVGAYADGNLDITESNEGNNGAMIDAMMLCPGKPDYIANITVESESPGNLTVRATTSNIDEVALADSITNLTDGSGNLLAQRTVTPLAAGANDGGFTYSISCVPGYNVTFNAIADAQGNLTESNEGNNAAGPLTVICPGSFDIELQEGWNLVSWPLTPSDNSSEWVFGSNPDIAIVWYYNNGSWYNYVPGLGGPLHEVTRGKAYMVNATAPTTLRVYGLQETSQPDPPFQIDVYADWNMLGIYAPAAGTMNYVTDSWPGDYYDADDNQVDPSTTIVPLGAGFWMYTNSAGFYYPGT